LRRPDLGRVLSQDSRQFAAKFKGKCDVAFILADGLSARAVERHAASLLEAVFASGVNTPDDARPLWIVERGRVAIGDAIGELIGAAIAVMLIGERPGLSSPDSLGIYLTWAPRSGRTDAERNCISNIHAHGLSYASAAHRLGFLLQEARSRKLSGVQLKNTAPLLLP
jgi:ethanolamine ammonia-lyase small subunit